MKRKILAFLSVCILACTTFCLFGCGLSKKRVVIEIDEPVQSGTTLLTVMEEMRDGGELKFEMQDGEIISINERENGEVENCIWVLYTSDGGMANLEQGTLEYKGQKLGKATLSADELLVEFGELYIWAYESEK